MPKRPQRRDTPAADEHVSETSLDDVDSIVGDENDENTPPVNDNNVYAHATYAPVHRSSSVLALHTPLSHSRTDEDTALRDITDQFFHPPSPSPVRVLKRSVPYSTEPPRRPKKPKSLAYPADPPNWLYSRSSSTLPPSSPLPPSTANVEHHPTDRSADVATTAQYEYDLGTPSKASDSDPFGFVAVEHALKAKRAPRKSTLRISAVKSPPRSTVLPSAPFSGPFSQLDAPVPTNNEDIEGLYADDEPVAGPSHVHVPAAPLLLMNSDQPYAEMDVMGSQLTFPDPLRTPRKRKWRASPTPDGDPGSDEEGTSVPSSPSPVKISVVAGTHRPGTARSSDLPPLKVTRARSKTGGVSNQPIANVSRTKRIKTSYQDIPTPSSTPASARRGSRQSTAPPTPVPLRRSTRQAVVGMRAERKRTTSSGEDEQENGRMKLRPRSGKTRIETESRATKTTPQSKHPPSKPRAQAKKATTAAKPARGRPKSKPGAKGTKGKGKTRALENVLDMPDDTREKYEKERRERLEYFKRLDGYQIQKENVYVI